MTERRADPQLAIHEFKAMDLSGATVIDGFPSVGLVSTICANYLIDVLALEQVGILDSPSFPTVAIVRNGVPMFPVRIYGGHGLCVFVSEFQPDKDLVRPIAQTILDFAVRKKCRTIISPEGLVTDEPGAEDVRVYALGSTDAVRERLAKAGLETFATGIITGVSG
ncbi:MAG: proteasome assembly chaperone family protein, partial [bacterium]